MDVGRLHRVLRLVTLLHSGSATSAAQLARELGVSRRTLFRDLNMLAAASIPYYHQPGHGYRIAASFFLPPVNLRVTEALGLMILAKAAAAQDGQPLTGPALEAVRKLVTMVPAPIREVCLTMMQRISVDPGATAIPNHDSDHHALCQQAIDTRRVVRMTYHSLFDRDKLELDLHPYHLHYSVRAWYVIGRSVLHDQVRTFKLARIQSLDLTSRRFTPDPAFNVDDYIGKAWALIPEGRVWNIELEFTPKVATNVSEIRWHPTQQHRILSDGRCIMTFEVDGLNEISWWLLGYGDQVIVRKPARLRQLLIQRYRAALDRYDQLSLAK